LENLPNKVKVQKKKQKEEKEKIFFIGFLLLFFYDSACFVKKTVKIQSVS